MGEHLGSTQSAGLYPIVVDGLSFALNGKGVSYRFHVDDAGDLVSDHFGGPVTEDPIVQIKRNGGGWSTHDHLRREFPDVGRGDFRTPAVRIKHSGHTVTAFKYVSHDVMDGKPGLPGLPATFGLSDAVKTLILLLRDDRIGVEVELRYSVFPHLDAIARSVQIKNAGKDELIVEKLASFSVDLAAESLHMLQLQGEWARECTRTRRMVDYGLQGFKSNVGYSSHYNNPFLSLVSPSTTEQHGDAWGFSLVYTGSFSVEVEKSPQGIVRAAIGMNPDQLSWPLKPGESITSPECVAVFADTGVGAMSRKFHRLFRHHLMRSKFANETRPPLLNSWEGVYFDFDEDTIFRLAEQTAEIGAELFVLDDGWFGVDYPRVDDHAGLGDWKVNPARFPHGLRALADKICDLRVKNSERCNMRFGLWFEPEMVNAKSTLYERHPNWVLGAEGYPSTESRHQLVLDLGLQEVQDFIISSVSDILTSAPVTYVKWDNNRGIHETSSSPTFHAYILGLYRVFNVLTTRFPDVIWEGCASGGGRYDPGILYYFPQVWTSDNTDALDRLAIQFGTSLAYPASSMGAHISAVPNHVTGRVTPLEFRAHVAMMGGSFGLELDPAAMTEQEKTKVPDLIALAKRINPVIVRGDLWRLRLPEESNFPAALFVSECGMQAVLFLFQVRMIPLHNYPIVRLRGLVTARKYRVEGRVYTGATLMNGGIQHRFGSDYDSKVFLIEGLYPRASS